MRPGAPSAAHKATTYAIASPRVRRHWSRGADIELFLLRPAAQQEDSGISRIDVHKLAPVCRCLKPRRFRGLSSLGRAASAKPEWMTKTSFSSCDQRAASITLAAVARLSQRKAAGWRTMPVDPPERRGGKGRRQRDDGHRTSQRPPSWRRNWELQPPVHYQLPAGAQPSRRSPFWR